MEEKKKRVVGKPFEVGNTVGGRTKGSMNRVTKFSREVLTLALAGQEENIRNALEKLSQKNPEAYISAVANYLTTQYLNYRQRRLVPMVIQKLKLH